jgi:hypothetical protein
MAIPELNAQGFLPAGYHECLLNEVRHVFCYTDHRKSLFRRLLAYCRQWRKAGLHVPMYIDGGFTERKPEEPKDIDVVVDITQLDLLAADVQDLCDNLFDQQAVMETYKVHVFAYHGVVVGAGQNDLRLFFGYVRPARRMSLGLDDDFRKGLLRVQL